jgi:hypothetical protein
MFYSFSVATQVNFIDFHLSEVECLLLDTTLPVVEKKLLAVDRLFLGAISTDRRNTRTKSFGWCFIF